jgi:hypothetical protein
MATFKRPIIRPPCIARQVFATQWVNGAQISQWVPANSCSRIPNGTPGRVGEIIDVMRKGTSSTTFFTPVWSPPYDYDYYARHAIPEEEREAYIKRCKDWEAENPSSVYKKTKKETPKYDYEMVANFWREKMSMPPLEDRVKVFRAAGMPEYMISRHEKWDKMMVDTAEERQKELDKMFCRYAPSSKTKTKPPKTKVLKPVKKKMV